MLLYITITAVQTKINLSVNVVQRFIWSQPKMTWAKSIAIILLLRGDVESTPGPLVSYENILAITMKF